MNLHKATKYAALIISILSASLVNEFVVKYIKSYYQEHTYQSVLIGMLVTVIVFVPLFSFLGKWINKASKDEAPDPCAERPIARATCAP